MDIRSPLIIIQINGQDLTADWMRRVRTIRLKEVEKKADTGEIVFSDGDYSIQDSKIFKKGAVFTMFMGWNNELEQKGPYIVKSYKPQYPDNGEPTFTVEFQDRSHSMNQRQRRRRFVSMRPEQIVERIAEDNNLDTDIEDVPNVEFNDNFPLLQANVTDARLMQTLSERYGYVWGVNGNTLYFRRPVDLDTIQRQPEVKVLSYRINDCSLSSFAPEVKNSSGRRRNAAGNRASNVNLMNSNDENNGIFDTASTRETVRNIIPGLGQLLDLLPGQEPDDTEPQGSNNVERTDIQDNPNNQRVTRRFARSVNAITTEFGRKISLDDPQNEESEPGDESGTATPDNAEEADRRTAARVARASEIVEGTAVPSVSSMSWKPSQAVILAGLAEHYCGRYRITEVEQSISGNVFKTALKVKRQTFKPSPRDRDATAEAADENQTTTGAGSQEGTPPNIQRSVNAITTEFGGTFVRRE